MCGLAGYCSITNKQFIADPSLLRSLHTSIAHRGPDGFGIIVSWGMGQRVKDTLCGTKVLWRSDYQKLAAQRTTFGLHDPFGDFDLLFGVAKLNRKIVDLPVRYKARTYGETKFSTIACVGHGLQLLRMCLIGMSKFRFR